MTLLEIVIVVSIIAIILATAVTKFGGALGNAQDTAAEMKISSLTSLLESYRAAAGSYPSESQGLEALVTKPSTSPIPRRWRQQMQKVPLDPWNQPFIYKYPGTKDPKTYEIISVGEDQTLGIDDDISSQNAY